MDPTTLRERLHVAVDQVVDDLLAEHSDGDVIPVTPDAEPDAVRADRYEGFTYRWPGGDEEAIGDATVYRLTTPNGAVLRVIVGWTTRHAWNADRGRAVVFYDARDEDDPARWYPWTEFVETDDGRFAATIPDPSRPRAILNETFRLPSRFAGLEVARADELFRSIREGASLRLVVNRSDEAEMIRHGYWVARLRGRV